MRASVSPSFPAIRSTRRCSAPTSSTASRRRAVSILPAPPRWVHSPGCERNAVVPRSGCPSTAETEVAAELPGYRAAIRVARTELELLIAAPLDGALAALENALKRNGISWPNVAAVVTVGGGASIPLIAQRLSGHSERTRRDDTAARIRRSGGCGALRGIRFRGRGPRPVWRRWPRPRLVWRRRHRCRSTRRDRRLSARWPGRRTTTSRTNPSRTPARTRMTPMPFRCVNPCSTCPATGPIEKPRTWQRLPRLVFGVAAAVALIAVGGVAIALTSVSNSTSATTEPPSTAESVRSRAPNRRRLRRLRNRHRHQRSAATARRPPLPKNR